MKWLCNAFSHLLDKWLLSLLKILQIQILGPNICKYYEDNNIYPRYFTLLLLFCAAANTTFPLAVVAVSSAGYRALTVSVQCLHVLSSKALQISQVLASTKLNMHIFNPFMCSTFTGEAAYYYLVINIHSYGTKSYMHYSKWQTK